MTSMGRTTRGFGFLEPLLARKRAEIADSLIPQNYRKGALLDIGCGRYPLFLSKTDFGEKHGLDKSIDEKHLPKDKHLVLRSYDLECADELPYEDDRFNVITMLAVLEHLDPGSVSKILSEVHRILRSGGICIITTPASWTDPLLRFLAKLKLVSSVEINEHKDVYSPRKVYSKLHAAGFAMKHITCGYFEIHMNIWAKATK